ncbi:MAG: hypothetical protein ACKOQM_14235 [Novosphingobium sp.]
MRLIYGLLLAAAPTALSAAPPSPNKAEIEEAASSSYLSYRDMGIGVLSDELIAELKNKPFAVAVDAVAKRHGIPSATLRRAAQAWVMAKAHGYGSKPAVIAPIHAELLDLAHLTRSNRLLTALIAEALDEVDDDCTPGDFAALVDGSTDPAVDGYIAAAALSCSSNFARAAALAGDRSMPALIRAAEWGDLPPRDTLPLYAWLTRPETLSHVREQDRARVATILWQRYFTELFENGLGTQALGLFDSLPNDLRGSVLSPQRQSGFEAVIDGITMSFEGEARVGSNEARDDFSLPHAPILQFVEALTLASRDDEARRLLATLPGLEQARRAVDCTYQSHGKTADTCGNSDKLPMGALIVDHLLNDPSADPYPIAETTLSGSIFGQGGSSDQILCRAFPGDTFPGICANRQREYDFSETSSGKPEDKGAVATFERIIPEFAVIRTKLLGELDQPSKAEPRYRRDTIAAIPPDFDERPLPANFLGAATSQSLRGLAPLPEGFELVRAERSGKRAVAISVSQTYDPSGEVSQGGYWVHVSDDAGKHWQKPLYTGLADRFPYVVAAASPLPLIDGDTLRVAVDVAEIDTASITYPPVGLRSRRTAKNRVLTIPLARLKQDTDNDGLTDLAAHHLLLDQAPGATATPFVVGSDDPAQCTAAPAPEQLALIALLNRMTGRSSQAIVEPVDRRSGELMTGWRGAGAATDQPIFLTGKRDDFKCLKPSRLMIVYDQADLVRMAPLTPDFRTLELPPIVFNRAHNRGYVKWSLGWTGGTFVLRLVNGQWQFDTTSSWIT